MHLRMGDSFASDWRDEDPRADGHDLEDLLDDPHCRYLLDHLRWEDDPVEVGTLARHVVAGITDTPPEDVSDEVERRVQTWLHHGQLPRLDAYGVVEFDPDAGVVRMGSDPRD